MKCIVKYLAALLVAAIPLSSTAALACTGVYVGKDASDQGTIIIARSEDQAWGDVNKRYMVQERMENVPGRYLEDKETDSAFLCQRPPINTLIRRTIPRAAACTRPPVPTSTV